MKNLFYNSRKEFIVFFFLLSLTTLFGQTKTYIGSNGVWNTASNWSPNGVPTATDAVVIPDGTVTISSNVTVKSISVTGTLKIDTAIQFTVNNDFTITSGGTFSLPSGSALATLVVYGNYYNNGGTNFWKSTVVIAGKLDSPSTSVIQKQGNVVVGGDIVGKFDTTGGNGTGQIYAVNPNATVTITPTSIDANVIPGVQVTNPETQALINLVNTVIYGSSCSFSSSTINVSACSGANSLFSVTTTGSSPTYQWQVNKNDGAGWNNLTNDASYSGVTLVNLTIAAVSVAMNNYKYRARVTSGGCSEFGNYGILTVSTGSTSVGGSVTGGSTICSGSTSALLTLSGSTGTIVRWESSVSPFSSWTTIANTSTTYTSGALNQTTQFRAVVQNGTCSTATSTATTVTITALNTVGVASSTPTLCINTPLTAITHSTTGATGIGTTSGLPSGVSATWLANTITINGTPTVSGTFNYTIPLTGGCVNVNATGTIIVNSNVPITQVGSTYTLCIDNQNTITTDSVNSGQFVVVDIVKGFNYTFSVGNVFATNENLTVLDAISNGNLTPSIVASGASGTSITWIATFSGQIKLLLTSNNCSSSIGGALTISLNSIGNTQDSQTAYGTNQWVAHVYNWTGEAPPGGTSPTTPSPTTSPFLNANYVGYYTIGTESISDDFGGDDNCFPVYSNGVIRTNMYSEQFAVRYRMRSTKIGCYSLSTTGDDGLRVYVDGVKVYDEWKEQSPTSYSNILLYLNGNSDIVFDYYENGVNNVNSFSLTPFDTNSNTISQSVVTVCSGVSQLLDGSSYVYNGTTPNPTISFQWQSSTDNITFTNIAGATTEDYTPPAQTTTTTNVVRYYRRVVSSTAATASSCNYTSNATTVTTTGVPSMPSSISGITSQCTAVTSQVYSISAITNTTSYNWTVPTGWTITSGIGTNAITVTTGTTGQNGSISVAAVNSCGTSSTKTLAVTVNSNNTSSTASSTPDFVYQHSINSNNSYYHRSNRNRSSNRFTNRSNCSMVKQ